MVRLDDTMTILSRKIVTGHLTNCDVADDGNIVRLNLVNQAGYPVSVEMSVEQTAALVMTLPRLLSKAVKARTNDERARFVFPATQWAIESTNEAKCLLVTITAADGFATTFAIPFQGCQDLGSALTQHAQAAITGDAACDDTPCASDRALN